MGKFRNRTFLVVLGILISISSNAWAWDCDIMEAEFIGKLTSLRTEKFDQHVSDCYGKIEFSSFHPSMLCPLYEDEVAEILLDYDSCDRFHLKVGDQISGRLGRVIGDNYIYLQND